jgi:hypothetical protein
MGEYPKIGAFQRIFRPEETAQIVREEERRRSPSLNDSKIGYRQEMYRRYVDEHQGEDFTGSMFEAMDKTHDAKVRSQFPFNTGGKGAAANYAKVKGSEMSVLNPTVRLGKEGVEPIEVETSPKIITINKIQKQIDEDGFDSLSELSKKMYKKYWKISDSKVGPEKADDWSDLEESAYDAARAKKIQRLGPGLEKHEYEATFDEMQAEIPGRFEFHYPEANVDDFIKKNPDKRELLGAEFGIEAGLEGRSLNIEIPQEIMGKGYNAVVQHLIDGGFSDQEAKIFIEKKTREELGK